MTNADHPSPENPKRPLLPDEPAPVDAKQRELTERYLRPFQTEIFDLLMEIRLSMDPALSAKFPHYMGKPYPLGRCLEITNAVRNELLLRLSQPRIRAEAALRVFLENGGIMRPIWGALRGKYFQNATQFGGLYVDVSNDTVDINKQRVEILLMEECDLLSIKNIDHFIFIANNYWNIDIYVNSIIPHLAPIFPMIGVHKSGKFDLLAANDYMIALSMSNYFWGAEEWLARGAIPPEEVSAEFGRKIPNHALNKENTPESSIAFCQNYRKEKRYADSFWKSEMIMEYIKIASNCIYR